MVLIQYPRVATSSFFVLHFFINYEEIVFVTLLNTHLFMSVYKTNATLFKREAINHLFICREALQTILPLVPGANAVEERLQNVEGQEGAAHPGHLERRRGRGVPARVPERAGGRGAVARGRHDRRAGAGRAHQRAPRQLLRRRRRLAAPAAPHARHLPALPRHAHLPQRGRATTET